MSQPFWNIVLLDQAQRASQSSEAGAYGALAGLVVAVALGVWLLWKD